MANGNSEWERQKAKEDSGWEILPSWDSALGLLDPQVPLKYLLPD